jgi:hypothetical protein
MKAACRRSLAEPAARAGAELASVRGREIVARAAAAQGAEHAVELRIAAKAGGVRSLKQVRAARIDQGQEALEPKLVTMLDQRESHVGLEDAGEARQADAHLLGDIATA